MSNDWSSNTFLSSGIVRTRAWFGCTSPQASSGTSAGSLPCPSSSPSSWLLLAHPRYYRCSSSSWGLVSWRWQSWRWATWSCALPRWWRRRLPPRPQVYHSRAGKKRAVEEEGENISRFTVTQNFITCYQHSYWSMNSLNGNCPTSPFTILEPENPWIDEFYVAQERRATGFLSSKIVKGPFSQGTNE